MVLKAIGQSPHDSPHSDGPAFDLAGGRFVVNDERQTSRQGVWAGGDCVAGGDDLTVSAVQDGKVAANAIHKALNAH